MNVAADRIAGWMRVEGRVVEDFKVVVTDNPASPWLEVSFVWIVAYDAALPDSYDFVVWEATGATHKVIDGEVQDPPLFTIT